jgi:hypothetical protein
MTTPRPAPALLTVLALLAAGCGLDDYERRMDEERARVKALLEENKHLGEQFVPPSNLEEPDPEKQPALQRAEVFLRLPRGISPTPAEEPAKDPTQLPVREPPTRSGTTDLYRCPGPKGYNVFVAATIDEKMPSDQFRGEVLAALRDYWTKKAKRLLPVEGRTPTTRVLQPGLWRGTKLPPVKVGEVLFDEPPGTQNGSRFAAYFHQAEGRQLAVIYQVPLADSSARAAIERSIATVALGSAAAHNSAIFAEQLPVLQGRK